MNLTIFTAVPQSGSAALSIDPCSLYHALEQVKDGREARGKRYPLALIFPLLLLGKLAGETTLHGALEWANVRASLLKKQLDWPRRFPRNAIATRALASCDAEQLVQVIAAVFLKARAEEERSKAGATTPLKQMAMDGKTLRGTLAHHQEHQPAGPVVSWYEPESGLVLAHQAIEDEHKESSDSLARHPYLFHRPPGRSRRMETRPHLEQGTWTLRGTTHLDHDLAQSAL